MYERILFDVEKEQEEKKLFCEIFKEKKSKKRLNLFTKKLYIWRRKSKGKDGKYIPRRLY